MEKFLLAGKFWADIEIEVEADSYEEAWSKVYGMPTEQLFSRGKILECDIDPILDSEEESEENFYSNL